MERGATRAGAGATATGKEGKLVTVRRPRIWSCGVVDGGGLLGGVEGPKPAALPREPRVADLRRVLAPRPRATRRGMAGSFVGQGRGRGQRRGKGREGSGWPIWWRRRWHSSEESKSVAPPGGHENFGRSLARLGQRKTNLHLVFKVAYGLALGCLQTTKQLESGYLELG